eukprot:15273343-Heterocapsa_arctica.AAC.1
MQAEFIEDWDKELEEYIDTAPQPEGWSMEKAIAAQEELGEVTSLLRRMPKGRAAPPWSVPTELFLMVLEPGRGMKKDKQLGVGHAE